MFALHIPFVFILTSPYFFVIYGEQIHLFIMSNCLLSEINTS